MFLKKQTCIVGCLIVGNLFFPCLSVLLAQEPSDTTKIYLLNEVEVSASPLPFGYKASSPLQFLNAENLAGINALQVSDAVKFFSGAQVKDYGGVGGLKTVSIRNLGANYTNVAYDGISVSDYQTGQTDLGRFSLDNVEMITFHIGEDDQIFQTAQMQSLAGTLNIVTQTFSPGEKKKNKLKASLKAGSFGFVNPSLWFGQGIGSVFSANVSADYIRTDGNYPFRQTLGFDNENQVQRIRNNSDVEALKLESNLTGKFGNGDRISFKMYYYGSERGLPGAAIYYNDYSGERLKDRNFFMQAHYSRSLHEKVDFQANAKANFSRVDYRNEIYAGGKLENRYDQREYYLNATFLYKFSGKISISWANDGIYGDFSTNQLNFKDAFPSRTSWLSALSGKYETAFFNATAKLLNTFVKNEIRKGNTLADYKHLSPYLGFSVKPVRNIPVRLRAFYKNTFRLPTFGDLYYSIQPAANLKPENAHQYNAGLTAVASFGTLFPFVSFSGDVYRYRIQNKIVAIPRGSMFIWSIQNYGKVDIKGLDLNMTAHIQTGSPFLWQITGTYTYQEALNKTDPESASYNKRLPYTSRHSASGSIGLKTPWIDVNYNLLYCGKRYYGEDNRPESQLKPFMEQGISLLRTIQWKGMKFTLTAECLNLLNVQYEIVNAYPMQGRSFRFGISMLTN
jgi:outer membrane cobalamin receptor